MVSVPSLRFSLKRALIALVHFSDAINQLGGISCGIASQHLIAHQSIELSHHTFFNFTITVSERRPDLLQLASYNVMFHSMPSRKQEIRLFPIETTRPLYNVTDRRYSGCMIFHLSRQSMEKARIRLANRAKVSYRCGFERFYRVI